MTAILASFHRVTPRTKPPYLARVNGFGCKTKQPMILLVESVENPGRNGPPFARAIIVSSPSKYPDHTPGNIMIITNFSAMSRMQLAEIPHSDS